MTEKEVHWSNKTSEKLIELFGRKKDFACAGGITPSGIVHIGNFRDAITSDAIFKSLKEQKLKTKLMFFWDDYDRLRKIPKNIPKSFSKYIGMPISKIPDPYKCHKSYAEHFKKEFEETMPKFGITLKFISQTKAYENNEYSKEIKIAMQKRREIAKILSEFKTQKFSEEQIENYYPLQVYCRKCGKDSTKILDYNGKNDVTYFCKCGHKEKVDISKENIGKLAWRVDWAMRWSHYGICFEPGGKDHATPGGSYDTSKKLAKEIFNIEPPLFEGYEFVGVRGTAKMSSSTGTGISPKELLQIYEPELLRWLFTRVNPKKEITFCFDSELIRQYDEFDREIESEKLPLSRKRALELAKIDSKEFAKKRVAFRQVASFGQAAQGNLKELKEMFKRINQKFDEEYLRQRLEKTQNWIEKYAKQFEIKVRNKTNKAYYNKLSKEEKEQIVKLRNSVEKNWNLDKLTVLVYDIPKKEGLEESEKKKRQRNFFKNTYQMLIGSDTGPRLATFLLALGKEKVKKLLEVK